LRISSSSKDILEEIPLRMCGVYTPPVVGEYVEDAQNKDEECGRPLCFETNGDHDTGGETEY